MRKIALLFLITAFVGGCAHQHVQTAKMRAQERTWESSTGQQLDVKAIGNQ